MDPEEIQRKLQAPLYKFLSRRLAIGFGITNEAAESVLGISKEVSVISQLSETGSHLFVSLNSK